MFAVLPQPDVVAVDCFSCVFSWVDIVSKNKSGETFSYHMVPNTKT